MSGETGIITLDGPAGAGKSTVGRRLAQSLHYYYLDSGSLYRAVAWQARRLGLDLNDPEVVGAMLAGFQPEIRADGANFHLLVDGREVREELRTPEVSRDASMVAKLPLVRQWVKEHLRWLARDRRRSGRRPGPGHRGLPGGGVQILPGCGPRHPGRQALKGLAERRRPARPWRRSGGTWPPGTGRMRPGPRRR